MSSKQEFTLRFSPSTNPPKSYKLLELPQELCNIIESGLETQFTIRGRSTDEAVLCTATKTYALRSVTLSNTIAVATAGESEAEASELFVRDELSQILELVPSIPKLHRLPVILKGCEYDEGHERDDAGSAEEEDEGEEHTRKRAKFPKESIRGEMQCSDGELAQGIKDYRILEVDGYLRPLAHSYLTHILETLLNALVSQNLPLPPNSVPISVLVKHLDLEHEIRQNISEQLLPWFGDVDGTQWTMDQKAVVRQVGLGRLMLHKDDPIRKDEFLAKWADAVGDIFSTSIDLSLLEGYYLLAPAPPASPTHLVYFPFSVLPLTATLLFADLFVTRPRWRAEDIAPFLQAVAVDGKERDKLLMKYARSTTDAEGRVWYTARATLV